MNFCAKFHFIDPSLFDRCINFVNLTFYLGNFKFETKYTKRFLLK